MRKYLKLMRVKHYIKNGLIFLPLIFSKQFLEYPLLKSTIYAFIAFCAMSSTVYILNDICDLEGDKNHSKKKKRPLASGIITVKRALLISLSCLVVSVFFNYMANKLNIYSWIWLFSYLVLNLLYSKGLKNVPVADIAILASGFVIRITYGSSITGIAISSWLYLTVLAMSFYLVLGKRRNEIKKLEVDTRKVLKRYTFNFLDKNMYMYLALTIGFYALWCVDPQTISNYGRNIIWTVPLVMLICMKYSLAVEGDSDGDPIEVVFSDKAILFLVLVYALMMFVIIYYVPLQRILSKG